MKRTIHTPLLLLAAAIAGEVQGQEVLFPTRDVGAISAQANNLSMSALDGVQIIDSSPLFLEQRNPGGVASSFGGQVNGASLRAVDAKNVGNLSVGFDYLRPWWSFRDFNLTVPPAYAGSFPVLASIGNTDNHFAFVPRVQYEYYLADWDLGIGASGKVLNLQGSLQRNVATSGGLTGNLISNNSLTIVSINPIEFSRSFTLDELFGEKDRKPCFADGKLDLTIGSRFVQLNQNYTGAVQVSGDGTSIASRYTSQSYSGFGLTSAMNWQCPMGNDFIGFSNLRASILAGENRRNSTLSINVTDMPGVAETIAEVKTQFVPIAEFEMGIEWGQDLGELLRNRQTKQQLTVRVSGLAQYWGGMGPLSAGSTQGFQTSDLFLGGVSVLVGFRH